MCDLNSLPSGISSRYKLATAGIHAKHGLSHRKKNYLLSCLNVSAVQIPQILVLFAPGELLYPTNPGPAQH